MADYSPNAVPNQWRPDWFKIELNRIAAAVRTAMNSGGGGVDLGGDYAWTGQHEWFIGWQNIAQGPQKPLKINLNQFFDGTETLYNIPLINVQRYANYPFGPNPNLVQVLGYASNAFGLFVTAGGDQVGLILASDAQSGIDARADIVFNDSTKGLRFRTTAAEVLPDTPQQALLRLDQFGKGQLQNPPFTQEAFINTLTFHNQLATADKPFPHQLLVTADGYYDETTNPQSDTRIRVRSGRPANDNTPIDIDSWAYSGDGYNIGVIAQPFIDGDSITITGTNIPALNGQFIARNVATNSLSFEYPNVGIPTTEGQIIDLGQWDGDWLSVPLLDNQEFDLNPFDTDGAQIDVDSTRGPDGGRYITYLSQFASIYEVTGGNVIADNAPVSGDTTNQRNAGASATVLTFNQYAPGQVDNISGLWECHASIFGQTPSNGDSALFVLERRIDGGSWIAQPGAVFGWNNSNQNDSGTAVLTFIFEMDPTANPVTTGTEYRILNISGRAITVARSQFWMRKVSR